MGVGPRPPPGVALLRRPPPLARRENPVRATSGCGLLDCDRVAEALELGDQASGLALGVAPAPPPPVPPNAVEHAKRAADGTGPGG